MKRQEVEVPGIRRIRIVWMLLDGRETRPMGGTMNVSAVFYLDGFFNVGDEAPKFRLDIFLGHRAMAIKHRVKGHLLLEVTLLEVGSFLLELPERVEATFFKAVLTIADKASGTVPFGVGLVLQGWIEARTMVGVITGLAGDEGPSIPGFTAAFAFLIVG